MLDIMHTDVMPVCTKLNERDMQKGKIKCKYMEEVKEEIGCYTFAVCFTIGTEVNEYGAYGGLGKWGRRECLHEYF